MAIFIDPKTLMPDQEVTLTDPSRGISASFTLSADQVAELQEYPLAPEKLRNAVLDEMLSIVGQRESLDGYLRHHGNTSFSSGSNLHFIGGERVDIKTHAEFPWPGKN